MKKILYCIWIIFPLSVFWNTYTDIKIENHRVQYITYSKLDQEYDIHIAATQNSTDFKNLVGQYGAVTGLNGVFFCPKDYSECGWRDFTINERFVKGKEIARYKSTGERVVFGWDIEENPFLYQTDKINTDREQDIYEWFANYPLLLMWWKTQLEHYYDVWLIDEKMRVPSTRHFICSTENGNEILFWSVSGASLDRLVYVLSEIGCIDALNLDAWKSSAFIYNWKYIQWPGRNILDGVVITRRWMDIKKINTRLEPVFISLQKKYSNPFRVERSKKKLWAYIHQIRAIKSQIYSWYETPLDNGYKIEWITLRDLERIYILNQLEYKMTQIKNTLGN